ncbi:hypothetical protein D1AOALGA4SA_9388 [Olavius algarvensis Delta 1 endosymbiont]|nr:hypothetical protein D1AOALGA4SA_9388 [Olavius algarvensis Delta 1 endosymbiont]
MLRGTGCGVRIARCGVRGAGYGVSIADCGYWISDLNELEPGGRLRGKQAGIRRSVFGIRCSAFGDRKSRFSVFGTRSSAFGIWKGVDGGRWKVKTLGQKAQGARSMVQRQWLGAG